MPDLADPQAWIGLATLLVLEIVLGIDNLIFIATLAARLPAAQQAPARRIGLAIALVARLALLAGISWLIGLTRPLVSLAGQDFSARDLIMIGGGLFLLWNATREIHARVEAASHQPGQGQGAASFGAVIVQIVAVDIVFSLDSVITAVGMAQQLWVMVVAVVLAGAVMFAASGPVARFVNRHPTVKMLALGFLLMIGMMLVADGFGVHVPKGYIYAAIGFSMLVEALNMLAARRTKRGAARDGEGPAGGEG